MRRLAVWVADWPVVAASIAEGVPSHRPAAVLHANRVAACSAVARSNGVRRGMRRRQAQAACPDLAVLTVDPARDARLFEPVAAAVEEVVVGVDVLRPGLVVAPADGAARYFGGPGAAPGTDAVPRTDTVDGEHRLVEKLTDHVAQQAGVECQVGVANGVFSAVLAARRGVIVRDDAAFLAPLPITELVESEEDGQLVDLLRRLGISTLGQFTSLSERAVVSRFGRTGLLAHRRAKGESHRPLARRHPHEELVVSQEFDPPLNDVEQAAVVAGMLGEKLHAMLTARSLACTRLGIYAVTEAAEDLARVWRCADPLDAKGIGDRVRWQFDGWLTTTRLSGGVVVLRLEPEEVLDARAGQTGLFTGRSDNDERAGRALVSVQNILGPQAVGTPVLDGGRSPAERVRFVPWGDARGDADSRPWPGRLPSPSPATVFTRTVKATVLDASGAPVVPAARKGLSAAPDRVAVDDGPLRPVDGWAGPWLVDHQWWAPSGGGVRVRVQVVLAGGEAFLLLHRPGKSPQWTVEGVY